MSLLPSRLLALWLLNVVLGSVGQLTFKAAATRLPAGGALARWIWMARRPWLWLGVGCFAAQFVLWLAFLSLVTLSRGMMLASLDIVVIYVAGRVLFDEKGSWLRLVGVLLIAAGVGIVAAFP